MPPHARFAAGRQRNRQQNRQWVAPAIWSAVIGDGLRFQIDDRQSTEPYARPRTLEFGPYRVIKTAHK
jgi:hypothetical protein